MPLVVVLTIGIFWGTLSLGRGSNRAASDAAEPDAPAS